MDREQTREAIELSIETAKQLLALARRYLAKGETGKAAHAMAQAEEMVTEVAKRRAREASKNWRHSCRSRLSRNEHAKSTSRKM